MIETAADMINIMTLQRPMSSISVMPPCDEQNIIGLQLWCREYELHNKYPVDILTRFNIGVYQIHQGMAWKDNGLNKYESYCAATLHFIMVAARLNLKLEDYLLLDVDELPESYLDKEVKELLYLISACTQQLYYSTVAARRKLKRSSRYNEAKFEKLLAKLIEKMISIVPKEYRREGRIKACEIMLGVL
jgi:hypothetical protein